MMVVPRVMMIDILVDITDLVGVRAMLIVEAVVEVIVTRDQGVMMLNEMVKDGQSIEVPVKMITLRMN
jgi:hypothetical protein